MIYFVVVGGKYINIINARKEKSAIERTLICSGLTGYVNVKAISIEDINNMRKRGMALKLSELFNGCTFSSLCDEELKNCKIEDGYIKS